MDKENIQTASTGTSLRGLSIGGMNMGYRKVGYAEQIWYIIKYKLQERFRKRK